MVVDLSLDVAALLRQSSMSVHDDTAQSAGAAALAKGELGKMEYVRYLMMLWRVYDALESGLDKHANDPVLVPTYSPAILARAAALSSDIAYLLQTDEATWPQHQLYASVINGAVRGLDAYVTRLRSATPAQLLAHAYTRYLGDLSGGQVVGHRVQKAYDIDADSTLGTQFYIFERDGKIANGGEMKRIKEWFRAGMIEGVGDDCEKKQEMCDEVVLAFRWNREILDAIRPPARTADMRPAQVQPKTSRTQHKQVILKSQCPLPSQRILNQAMAVLYMFLAAIIARVAVQQTAPALLLVLN